MKTLSIFGSTGTIGEKALRLAVMHGFEVKLLTAHSNAKKIIEQAINANPEYVCVTDRKAYETVVEMLCGTGIKVLPQIELLNVASMDVDTVVMAISGNAALRPTFACLGNAKRLALASKEVIISGGRLFLDTAKKLKTEIVPVDSEHSAIFQCLKGEDISNVSEMYLTASGGSFLNFDENELDNITPEMATKHPKWNMGKKITVDSSTLINKALEIIEAHYLFEIPIDKIKPIIHPESIIHGMIKFADNSYKIQASYPDMSIPISYALNYPNRSKNYQQELDFESIKSLTFKQPKTWQLRNMNLAYEAAYERKVIAFNVLNEIAVNKFLRGSLKFNEIYYFIKNGLDSTKHIFHNSIDGIFFYIAEILKKYS